MARYKDKSYECNLELEDELFNKGHKYIACSDEVGRGCFAGPVVAAAVIMPKGVRIPFLTDSKLVPKNMRRELTDMIVNEAIAYKIAVIEPSEIDKINILQASLKAMKESIEGLSVSPDYCLIDGNKEVSLSIPQKTVVKGDYFSHGISAASLLAKVYRDDLMEELDKEYRGVYEWSKNVGYPTKRHIELTKEHGVTKYHRLSWKTMEKLK